MKHLIKAILIFLIVLISIGYYWPMHRLAFIYLLPGLGFVIFMFILSLVDKPED